MSQQRICKHAGDTKEQVHFHQTDVDSWHQNRHHIHPERHLCQPVKMKVFNVPETNQYHPEMYIYILRFQKLNYSISM